MRPSMLAFSLRCNDILLGCAFSPSLHMDAGVFCMIMMYNEIQPWIDDYQVFVWVLVGLHHSFVILELGSWKYLIKILFQHWFVSLALWFNRRSFAVSPRLIWLSSLCGGSFVPPPANVYLERYLLLGNVLHPSQGLTTCQNLFFLFTLCAFYTMFSGLAVFDSCLVPKNLLLGGKLTCKVFQKKTNQACFWAWSLCVFF